MSPAEKSLAAVKDAIEIIESVGISGKDAHRIVNCLNYLKCLKAEHEKEVLSETPAPAEVTSEQGAA